MKRAADVVSLLKRYRFNFTNEDELHRGIADVFTKNGVTFVHEKILSKKDRIDFLIGGVGIEIKVKGSPSAVARQVIDYLKYDEISEIILVTSRGMAAEYLREVVSEKKITILDISGTRL